MPLQTTADPGRKFEPVTAMVNPGAPANTEDGVTDVMTGPLTGNFTGVDSGDPGFCTTTVAVCGRRIRLASTSAVTCVALAPVVNSGAPFHRTWAPGMKPAPATVIWNDPPPATAEGGFSPLGVGALGAVTRNERALV